MKNIVPGMLVRLHDVSVGLHSDWCWQQEDSGTRQVDVLRTGEIGLVLAVVQCGYPRPLSQQVLVLTSRGNFGWNSKEYFMEVRP